MLYCFRCSVESYQEGCGGDRHLQLSSSGGGKQRFCQSCQSGRCSEHGSETVHDLSADSSPLQPWDSRRLSQSKAAKELWREHTLIILKFSPQLDGVAILFDSDKCNMKRLIDISDPVRGLTQPFSTDLLSLHDYTGCDSTSGFKGKSKTKAVKILQQKPAFVQTLAQLDAT